MNNLKDEQEMMKERLLKTALKTRRPKYQRVKPTDNPTTGYPTKVFDKEDLKPFLEPLVYIYSRYKGNKFEVIYIGVGQGMSRPLDPRHHQIDNIRKADKLQIFYCETYEEAKKLEKDCIKFFNPLFNKEHQRESRKESNYQKFIKGIKNKDEKELYEKLYDEYTKLTQDEVDTIIQQDKGIDS